MASRLEQTKGTFASRSQTASSKAFQRFAARSSSSLPRKGRTKPELERWPQRDDQFSSAYHATAQKRISEPESADCAKPRLDSRSRRFQADGHHRTGAGETRSEHQGRIRAVRKSSAALEGAEEQLREVGALGHSINDLNNLLKLPICAASSAKPVLSGFWRTSCRPHVCLAGIGGRGRRTRRRRHLFPRPHLPIDAKFPREQVAALFENSNEPKSTRRGLRWCA